MSFSRIVRTVIIGTIAQLVNLALRIVSLATYWNGKKPISIN